MNNNKLQITIGCSQDSSNSKFSIFNNACVDINIAVKFSERGVVSDKSVSGFHSSIKHLLYLHKQEKQYPAFLNLYTLLLLNYKKANCIHNKFIMVFLSATNQEVYKQSIEKRRILSQIIYDEKKNELGEEVVKKSIYYKLL